MEDCKGLRCGRTGTALAADRRKIIADQRSHRSGEFAANLVFQSAIIHKNLRLIIVVLCQMPTVKGILGPRRFFFYSFDCNERMHVHVQRERMVCKYWLQPIGLANNQGFKTRELNQIRKLIESHLTSIERQWHEHCDPE